MDVIEETGYEVVPVDAYLLMWIVMVGGSLTEKGRSRLLRGLLLVMLALGVCGMHTLGHLGPSHGDVQATSSTHQGHDPQPSAPGMDPTSVCVAILVSVLVLALVVRRGWVRRTLLRLATAFTHVLRVARPPPPTALRLASLSVMRI